MLRASCVAAALAAAALLGCVHAASHLDPGAGSTCPSGLKSCPDYNRYDDWSTYSPFARDFMDSVAFKIAVWVHASGFCILAVLMPIQWLREKGDKGHVALGNWIRAAIYCTILTGFWLIFIRQQSLEGPTEAHPNVRRLFPTFIQWRAVGLFGLSLTSLTLQAFITRSGSPAVKWVCSCFGLTTILASCYVLPFLLYTAITYDEPAPAGYPGSWPEYVRETAAETFIILLAVPVFHLCNLYVILTRYPDKGFSWKYHHKFNMILITGEILIPLPSLFVAHDAWYIFDPPGVENWIVRSVITMALTCIWVTAWSQFLVYYLTGVKLLGYEGSKEKALEGEAQPLVAK